MFNKIKYLIARYRLRKWFIPAENHELSRLGRLYGVYRFVYPSEIPNTSENYPVRIYETLSFFYLETDEHYRKRITDVIK